MWPLGTGTWGSSTCGTECSVLLCLNLNSLTWLVAVRWDSAGLAGGAHPPGTPSRAASLGHLPYIATVQSGLWFTQLQGRPASHLSQHLKRTKQEPGSPVNAGAVLTMPCTGWPGPQGDTSHGPKTGSVPIEQEVWCSLLKLWDTVLSHSAGGQDLKRGQGTAQHSPSPFVPRGAWGGWGTRATPTQEDPGPALPATASQAPLGSGGSGAETGGLSARMESPFQGCPAPGL